MLEAILAWNAMTLICGRMNLRFLNQPGQIEIQSDIFYDYRTNVETIQGGKLGCVRSSRACW